MSALKTDALGRLVQVVNGTGSFLRAHPMRERAYARTPAQACAGARPQACSFPTHI